MARCSSCYENDGETIAVADLNGRGSLNASAAAQKGYVGEGRIDGESP